MLLAVYQEWQLSNLLTQRPGIRQMSFRGPLACDLGLQNSLCNLAVLAHCNLLTTFVTVTLIEYHVSDNVCLVTFYFLPFPSGWTTSSAEAVQCLSPEKL